MTATPVQSIDPRIDAYGTTARAGALADYVEASALLGWSMTKAELTDVIEQQDWSQKSRRVVIATADDPETDPTEWSEQAFASISERIDILEDRYPFVSERGALKYAGPADPHDDPYVALLALTIVHAWKVPCSVDAKEVLETTVAETLSGRSLQVAGMGTGDRVGTSFVDNLRAGGRAVGVKPSDDPRPRRTAVKDAGVDTLASLAYADGRQGQWTFVGQVTCGSSASWMRKLKEPDTETWRGYLQEGLAPQAFLAVPHHIDYQAWEELVTTRAGLLIDRLRICLHKNATTVPEKVLVKALLACTYG